MMFYDWSLLLSLQLNQACSLNMLQIHNRNEPNWFYFHQLGLATCCIIIYFAKADTSIHRIVLLSVIWSCLCLHQNQKPNKHHWKVTQVVDFFSYVKPAFSCLFDHLLVKKGADLSYLHMSLTVCTVKMEFYMKCLYTVYQFYISIIVK
jgi:hypothetical protein